MDFLSEFVITQAGEQGESQGRRILTGLSLNAKEILHKAANAWRPSFRKLACDWGATEEERKTPEVLRELRAILNKLTPDNFGSLMKRLSRLEINTEARLKAVIGLIFDKAVSEQSYCPTYAKMCHHLLGLNVATEDGHCVTFQKVLLCHCQSQFEKNHNEEEMINIQEELDATENEADCQRLKLKLEEVHFISRRRSLGNMKLIGELFKLKMLTAHIMHDCVVKLLKDEHEESLECLCKLMSTIGKDLDTPNAKPDMDQYFAHINKIIQRKNISTRTRFMLLDVTDLRKNNWVPRRDEEGPKVIREIHVKADLALPGQGKGGLNTEKGKTRCHPQEKKRMTNPDDKPSTTEQEPCSKDSRADESEHSDLTSADGDQSHRSHDVRQWFERSDLHCDHEACLLDSAHHRGQFEPTIGDQSQRSSGDGTGSEKPELTARADNRRNRIPHDSDQFDKRDLTLDHENWHHRSEDHIEKFGRNGESSRGGDWRLRKDGERDHLDRSDSLSESQNWRVARKKKSSDQESSRFNNWRRRSDHEGDHLDRFGNFSKSQNWRDTTTFKSPGQEISRCNSWRFKVGRERHHLDRSDHLCNSHNWRVTSNNESSDQESSWYNNWRFKGDRERDQQNQSEHLSNSQGLCDTRPNRRSGPSKTRSNCEWRNHQRRTSHRNNRKRNNNTFKRVEDMSNYKNWHAINERKQLVQKILNLDSEKWRIRPDHYRSDCNFESENWPHREYGDRNQSDRVAVKHKPDAREVIKKRLIAKDSEKEMEKVTVENNMTKDLTRLLGGETSNQQLTNWIEANLSNQEVSSIDFVQVLMTSVCLSTIDVLPGGVHQLNGSKIIQRSEVLKKYLNNGQKQREALKALQNVMEQTKPPSNVTRLLIDILFDEEVIGEDVSFTRESSAEPKGSDASLKSVGAFLAQLHEGKISGAD